MNRSRLASTVAAAAALIYVASLIHDATAALLSSRPLSPRWDQATHLVTGWTDAYYVRHGRFGAVVADLWSQGYWPPGLSLFQMPFFLALGPGQTSGLWASLAAFVLLGVVGASLVASDVSPRAAAPAVAAWLLFLVTSPFALAYASVAMMEMPGLLTHVLVFACYAHDLRTRSARSATWLALALSVTFFVKYNYFVLVAAPLLVHDYLSRTHGMTLHERGRLARSACGVVLASFSGRIAVAYLVFAAAIEITGGFVIEAAGQRLALRTIGYSAHPVLYGLLLRLWYLQRRGRIDWDRVWALDRRLRPLVIWFVVPVTLWLASPFPNHVKDVANLLFNTPMGPSTAASSLAAYLDAAARDYFGSGLTQMLGLVAIGRALLTFNTRSALVRLLVLAAAMEFLMVTVHPTRDPRFLGHAMLPLWLAGAIEIGGLLAQAGRRPAAVGGLVLFVWACTSAGATLRDAPASRLAIEHYVESADLRQAWQQIRADLGARGQAAVLGRRDAVSPGLVRWELGPPSGQAAYPLEILRVADTPLLAKADAVVLVAPLAGAAASSQELSELTRDEAWLRSWLENGRLVPSRVFPIRDLGISLRVYRRSG